MSISHTKQISDINQSNQRFEVLNNISIKVLKAPSEAFLEIKPSANFAVLSPFICSTLSYIWHIFLSFTA